MSIPTNSRIRGRLSYTNVVATLALVFAIGGGTAAAIVIVGGAPAGFDAVKGVGARSQTVLGVPGVGAVKAKCDEHGVVINWKNQTDGRQLILVDDGGADPRAHSLGGGEVGIIIRISPIGPAPGKQNDMLRLQAVSPSDGGTPMAEVGIIINWTPGDCQTAFLGAQSLSSEK
jgi:hypothetical protein